MKVLGTVVGLAALLAAGSANASIVFDTLTGQSMANSNLLTTAAGFHAPLGTDFTASYSETINSVSVGLYEPNCGTSTTHCGDTGSVLVYLVQGTGSPSLPSSSGLKLANPIFLGSISDSSLVGGNLLNDVTLTTNTTIGAGTWWIELTSASDPNNFDGTINPTGSTAKWGEILATTAGTIGVPTGGWYTSGSNLANTGIIGGISNHSNSGAPSPNDEVFMASVSATPAPEPTSLALFGAGLMGLGFQRYRRSNKTPTA
jgi:hypothetical protein